jgi:hypothetical protein
MKKLSIVAVNVSLLCFGANCCNSSSIEEERRPFGKTSNEEWRELNWKCDSCSPYNPELVANVEKKLWESIAADQVATDLLKLLFAYLPMDFIEAFPQKLDQLKLENQRKFLELLNLTKFTLTTGGYWVEKIYEIVKEEPFFQNATKLEQTEFVGDVFVCLAQKAALDKELDISRECSERIFSTLRYTIKGTEKYEKMKMPLSPDLMRINEMVFCKNCKEGEGFGDIAKISEGYIQKITDKHAHDFLEAFMDERIVDSVGIAEQHLKKRPNEDAAKCMELLSIVAGRYEEFDDELTQRIVNMYDEKEVTLSSLQYKEFCAVILAMTSYKSAREKSNGLYSTTDHSDADFYAEMTDMISKTIPGKLLPSLKWVYRGEIKEWNESPSAVWPNWDE